MTRAARTGRRRGDAIRFLLIGIALIVALLPLAWTGLAAIGIEPHNDTSPPSFVGAPSLDHLAEVSVVEPAFWQELATSVGVSVAAAIIASAVSFLAAFVIARSGSSVPRRFNPAMLVLATLPVVAYVLPLRDVLRRLGMFDTLPGITFAEAAVTAPLAVYVFCAYLVGVSRDGEEAAKLDGASVSTVLRHVALPAAGPTIAATATVLFVLDWNLLLTPLVLTGIDVRTLPVILTDFFTLEREVDWPTAAAALMISLVPLIVLVGLFHRAVERFSLGGTSIADVG